MESLQDAEKRKQLEALSEKFFGRPLAIKISPLGSGESTLVPEQRRRNGEDREGMGDDVMLNPLVAEALRIFKGKVVEVKGEGTKSHA